MASTIAASWANGSTSFSEDLKSVLATVGTEDVKNLTVSAALLKLIQGGGDRDMLNGLLAKAKELGVAERPAVEMTTAN